MPPQREKSEQGFDPYERERIPETLYPVLVRDREIFLVPKSGLFQKVNPANVRYFNDVPWTAKRVKENPEIFKKLIKSDPNNSPSITVAIPHFTFERGIKTHHPVNYKPSPEDTRFNNVLTLTCELNTGEIGLHYNDSPDRQNGKPIRFQYLHETMDGSDLSRLFTDSITSLAKHEDSKGYKGIHVEDKNIRAGVSIVMMFMGHAKDEMIRQFTFRSELRSQINLNPDPFFATLFYFTNGKIKTNQFPHIQRAASVSWQDLCKSLEQIECHSQLFDPNYVYTTSASVLISSRPEAFLNMMSHWNEFREWEEREVIAMFEAATAIRQHNTARFNNTSHEIRRLPIHPYFSVNANPGETIHIKPAFPEGPPRPLSLPESSISRNTPPLQPKKRLETDPSDIDTGETDFTFQLKPGERDELGFTTDDYHSLNNPDFPTSE